jgi:hypothetical protein
MKGKIMADSNPLIGPSDQAGPDNVQVKHAVPSVVCPICGNPATVDKHNSLRCANCGNRSGTFSELWIDLQTRGPLSADDAGDETLCELRQLIREQFGTFDFAGLCRLRDWLVASCGMTREQVNVAQRTRLVELLNCRMKILSDAPRKPLKSGDSGRTQPFPCVVNYLSNPFVGPPSKTTDSERRSSVHRLDMLEGLVNLYIFGVEWIIRRCFGDPETTAPFSVHEAAVWLLGIETLNDIVENCWT